MIIRLYAILKLNISHHQLVQYKKEILASKNSGLKMRFCTEEDDATNKCIMI